MHLSFHASHHLPPDIAATIVVGDKHSTLLLNAQADAKEIAAALSDLVGRWAEEEWLYVGRCGDQERQLRALG